MLIHGRIITPIKLYLKNESSFLKCKYVDYMAMAFISVHLDDSSRKNRPCIFIINHECHSISYAFSVIVTFVSNLQKIQKQKQSFLLLLALRVPYIKLLLQNIYKILLQNVFYKRSSFLFN